MVIVVFYIFGCKVNYYEIEVIWQLFKDVGYE